MVDVSIKDRTVVFEVLGLHKIWALKSRLIVPLPHIRGVHADPTMTLDRCKGLRLPGTYVPGLIAAGTYYSRGRRVFWDVVRPQRSIVVDLADERYEALIVEVADPDAVVKRLQAALGSPAV
jgi:hypothetical protein